ncbi:unnamed protein product [Rotaria sordida]|uniref:Xylose isomerase n=1 Tax=Rotaria sordida TaxID=392033 RepID=A0A815LZ61_9BILA|nr:unnamed protein product [Rotaria sordida]CAF1467992.1 unnamed protein product [Rotaria sordida]CAF3909984.1 unnamed protein product [Rotaria sordida]CAF3995339.1 unnamed protein product [Rotaria sordida]
MPAPQLKFIRALWGAEAQFSTDIDRLFAEFHRLGYAGVEATLSDIHRISQNDRDAFRRALHDNKLELVGLVQTNYPTVKNNTWQDLPIDEHLANLEYHFEEFMPYKPIHVNIQGGQDSWSIEENEQFFEKALEIQAKYPQVTSSHETHRSRSLYNPFITAHMVKRFPTLRLTADYSHFILVCERLLEHPTDDERFRLFASRVDHLHARVGFAEHAQVNDPLEFKKETEQMQRWWEMIWDAQKNRTWTTLTPEYGPAPYAMTSEINVWDLTNREMERQKKNYAKWSNTVQ